MHFCFFNVQGMNRDISGIFFFVQLLTKRERALGGSKKIIGFFFYYGEKMTWGYSEQPDAESAFRRARRNACAEESVSSEKRALINACVQINIHVYKTLLKRYTLLLPLGCSLVWYLETKFCPLRREVIVFLQYLDCVHHGHSKAHISAITQQLQITISSSSVYSV